MTGQSKLHPQVKQLACPAFVSYGNAGMSAVRAPACTAGKAETAIMVTPWSGLQSGGPISARLVAVLGTGQCPSPAPLRKR
ncbi:hypothetical protein SKAU_G00112280 [Synaphobranchus kaupii]|uniref:Uncharacterized protein n=1 Tax=Synaphobranchus kaupii TaxID=118154 RepID=A0A9Q1G1H4_SYNKA|nr:hypothetical protein SKAU_G00112280 [Synaphobranchus kaupii]